MARTRHGLPGIYNATPITLSDEEGSALGVDVNGYPLVNLAYKLAGEDLVNDVIKVEERFSYGTEASADSLQKTGAGFLHAVIYDCTVAGTLVIRDSTTAGGGTIIKTLTLVVGQNSLLFDVAFATGLYLDFGTATATVNVSYR